MSAFFTREGSYWLRFRLCRYQDWSAEMLSLSSPPMKSGSDVQQSPSPVCLYTYAHTHANTHERTNEIYDKVHHQQTCGWKWHAWKTWSNENILCVIRGSEVLSAPHSNLIFLLCQFKNKYFSCHMFALPTTAARRLLAWQHVIQICCTQQRHFTHNGNRILRCWT